MGRGEEEVLLFTYAVLSSDNKEEKYLYEKTLIIKNSREIIYQVFSTQADVSKTNFPRFLHKVSILPDILKKFKDVRICKGIRSIDINFVSTSLPLQRCVSGDWRHDGCSMISINSERCTACKKYSKVLSQRNRRAKSKKNFQRFSRPATEFDQMKLKALKKR